MKVPRQAIKICRNFVLRSGTVAGVMYYFQQSGVWGTPAESGKIYENFKNKLTPHANEIMERFPNETAMISKLGDIGNDILGYYNGGIKETFSFIQNLPQNSQEMAKHAAEFCKQKRQQFIEISKSKLKLRASASSAAEERLKVKIIKSDGGDNTNIQETETVLLDSNSGSDPDSTENKQQLLLLSSCL